MLGTPVKGQDAVLRSIARSALGPVLTGFGIYYSLLWLAHLLFIGGSLGLMLATMTAASALAIWVARACRGRLRLDAAPNTAVLVVGLVILANSAFHLWLTESLTQSINVGFTVVGAGLLLADPRHLLIFWCTAWGSWLSIAATRSDDPELAHYVFMMITATTVSVISWNVRIRSQLALDTAERSLRTEEERRAIATRLAQRQRLESLGRLAGRIGHDFNNLLGIILGNASFLRNEKPEPPLREALTADIVQAAERASRITAEMLVFAGRGGEQFEDLDLAAVVDDMIPLLHTSLPKQVRLAWRRPKESAPVAGDSAQIRQVVIGLVENAARGAETQGERTVWIRVREERTGSVEARWLVGSLADDAVLLEVEDTGQPLDEAELQRCLEPFDGPEEAAGSHVRAIVAGIARSHDAAFGLVEGSGPTSRFVVAFPPRANRAPAEAPEAADTVLVVDDEPLIRQLARRVLEGAGYRVTEAGSGQDAARQVLANPNAFCVLLLDLTLPDLNGVELLKNLRVLGCGAPVVFSSGYSELDLPADYLREEGAIFLRKPYRHKALVQAVATQAGQPPLARGAGS